MWPFKKKIREEPKRYPYQRRYESSNYSVWDNLSFIEKFCMVFMPVMLGFIFYMMCDAFSVDLKWWYRLPISVGGVALCIGLITGLVNYFVERY